MSTSLAQSDLFPPGELPEGGELLLTEAQQRELYPLSTIGKNQERLDAILHLLGANAPLNFICRTQHVGWHTLQSIREKHGAKIADIKKRVAARAAMFAELGIEQMLEDLQAGRLDPDKLAISWAVVVDKLQVLTGEPTVIHGSSDGPKRFSVDELRERLARARPERNVTGSAGEGAGQTREIEVSARPIQAAT